MPSATSTARPEPWGAVLALGITQITAWGSIYYLFPLVMEPLQEALGASKSAVVGAFTGALLLSGMLAPVVGRYIDRRGGRALMAAGSLLAALSLAALGQVNSLTQLYVVWALLGVAMAGTLYEPAFAVLTRAFVTNHRRAIAVLTLFGGFASTVFWPLGQGLINAFGWREAAMIFGAINLLVCVPLHLTVLPRGEPHAPSAAGDTSTSRSLGEAVRDPTFHLLAAAFTANAFVFSAMSVHLLAMMVAKGFSATQAATLGALIGPMQVLGRLSEMSVGQRLAPSSVGAIAMALLPASVLLFVYAGASTWSFIIFAVLYGAGNGVMTIVRGTVPVELYGRDHFGAVNGAMAAPVLIAKAVGPLAAAVAWTIVHDYDSVALLLAAVAFSSLVFFGWAVRRRREQ
jgi:MFS family permease